MSDWHLISDVCPKIYVLFDLINVRDWNISCYGFTGAEISFMIYGICVNWNCILIDYVSYVYVYMYLFKYHI